MADRRILKVFCIAHEESRLTGSTRLIWAVGCLIFMCLSSGCAIHHYDAKTGTEHVWGFGHVAMRSVAANEGLQGVVSSTEFLGLVFSSSPQESFFSAGYSKQQRLHIIDADAAFRLEWPTADLLNVRIGSEFPHLSKNSAEGRMGDK